SDDAAADWLLGFVAWAAEAHEPGFLYEWFGLLSGNSQLGADALLSTYQARLKDHGAYRLSARRPARSLGAVPPRMSADGAEIRPRCEVEYWAYLPDRPLALRLLGPRSAVVSLKLDDGPAKVVEIGPAATAPSTRVQGLGKWQRVTVASAAPEPAALGWIEVRRAAVP
ncbi:MAG: hypothetical protein HYU66_04110, partial [Armatimonadetes bacterium]|nr:hypothetical protein [Armatimonadota bacterium]